MGRGSVSQKSTWFLVETNYDHWSQPPFFDDRRTPAIKCLDQMGRDKASPTALFNILSTKPVFNEVWVFPFRQFSTQQTNNDYVDLQLTTYTCIMDVTTGQFEAWLRHCPHPCKPWWFNYSIRMIFYLIPTLLCLAFVGQYKLFQPCHVPTALGF